MNQLFNGIEKAQDIYRNLVSVKASISIEWKGYFIYWVMLPHWLPLIERKIELDTYLLRHTQTKYRWIKFLNIKSKILKINAKCSYTLGASKTRVPELIKGALWLHIGDERGFERLVLVGWGFLAHGTTSHFPTSIALHQCSCGLANLKLLSVFSTINSWPELFLFEIKSSVWTSFFFFLRVKSS